MLAARARAEGGRHWRRVGLPAQHPPERHDERGGECEQRQRAHAAARGFGAEERGSGQRDGGAVEEHDEPAVDGSGRAEGGGRGAARGGCWALARHGRRQHRPPAQRVCHRVVPGDPSDGVRNAALDGGDLCGRGQAGRSELGAGGALPLSLVHNTRPAPSLLPAACSAATPARNTAAPAQAMASRTMTVLQHACRRCGGGGGGVAAAQPPYAARPPARPRPRPRTPLPTKHLSRTFMLPRARGANEGQWAGGGCLRIAGASGGVRGDTGGGAER